MFEGYQRIQNKPPTPNIQQSTSWAGDVSSHHSYTPDDLYADDTLTSCPGLQSLRTWFLYNILFLCQSFIIWSFGCPHATSAAAPDDSKQQQNNASAQLGYKNRVANNTTLQYQWHTCIGSCSLVKQHASCMHQNTVGTAYGAQYARQQCRLQICLVLGRTWCCPSRQSARQWG
jgi:hypothetical protein